MPRTLPRLVLPTLLAISIGACGGPPAVEAPTPIPSEAAVAPSAAPIVLPTVAPAPSATTAPSPQPPTATPEPPTATPEPPAAGPRTYTVQPGDTLRSIAEQFGVSVQALLDANGLTPEQADSLRQGQELIIP